MRTKSSSCRCTSSAKKITKRRRKNIKRFFYSSTGGKNGGTSHRCRLACNGAASGSLCSHQGKFRRNELALHLAHVRCRRLAAGSLAEREARRSGCGSLDSFSR